VLLDNFLQLQSVIPDICVLEIPEIPSDIWIANQGFLLASSIQRGHKLVLHLPFEVLRVPFDFFRLRVSVRRTQINLFVGDVLLFLKLLFELVHSFDLQMIEITFQVFDSTVENVLESFALVFFSLI
jgi:hypothetical protein